MFWRRLSACLLCLSVFAIPIEHKYDKLFRFFSLKLIPSDVVLPLFFEKKIYFYPSDIIAIVLFFIALFATRIPLSRFFFSRGAPFLWIVFLCTLISILFSPLAHYPIPYIRLLQLFTPILLFSFLATASDRERITSLLLHSLVAAAVIQSGIAIAQYAIQGPLGLRFIGEPTSFSLFGIGQGHRWIFDSVASKTTALLRPSGTLPHANVLGGFLSLSLLATYALISQSRHRLFLALSIPIQFFAMTLTFSRSALFSFAIGTLVWFGLHWKKNGIRRDPAVRVLLSALCLLILCTFFVLREPISQRGGIVNYNQTAQNSDRLRLRYQTVALQIIKDHPFFGAGFHQFSLSALDYVQNDPNYPPNSGTHNIYLYLAAETGLLSLAAFLFFIFSLLWAGIKAPFSPALASLVAMFIAILFIGGCDFYPLLFQQGKLLFFLTAGLLASHAYPKTDLVLEAA